MSYKTRQTISWLLFALIILYIITGLGITQYRIIEKLTGGLLTKNLSFKIHTNLIYLLIVLVILHVYPNLKRRKKE